MLLQFQQTQNHVVFILDASDSMRKHENAVRTAVDNEIKYLATRSQQENQETRVSVYVFSNRSNVKCVIYDCDVLRLPSIKDIYKTHGMTALVDATVLAINDLQLTPQRYGDHSFLVYLFTDGMNNDSTLPGSHLRQKIDGLKDNWTFVAFVPDQIAKAEAGRYGIPKDNIAIWDTSSVRGFEEVAKTVRQTSDNFFQMRKSGGRGSRSVFKLNTLSPGDIVNQLTYLYPTAYVLKEVPMKYEIKKFVEDFMGITYQVGHAFYQLTKNEHIQAGKKIAVMHNNRVYVGDQARKLLGLPDNETVLVNVKDDPAYKPYAVFVQSGSVNRNLIPGQQLLYIL